MKIVFFESEAWEQEYIQNKLPNRDISFIHETLSPLTLSQATDAEIVSVFIYSKVTKEILDALPQLKLIVTRSTGFDHIDLEECKVRNILVCNVPTYGENTVAEHTFALILALSRKVHQAYIRVQKGDYSVEGLKGFDLKGKTIGVIGTGHIGLHVIRIARGFGMNVLAYTHHPDNFLSEIMEFENVPFEQLLEQSDIITLHVPLNDSTYHLINTDNISKVKKGSIIINTARGDIVETDALIEALDNKYISGAGLDVIEGEEYIKEEKQLLHENTNQQTLQRVIQGHVLLSKENVVFTPHIAFYSQEALERILDTTIENIQCFNNGNPIDQVL